jgi:adenosylmethionine-8-amino-7-oxononanoate aminotransferase
MSHANLARLDRAHAWHPYAAMPGEQQPLLVESARAVRLKLSEPVDGVSELIDGMSSWWAAIHGYRHPVLDEAMRSQAGRMSHVMFGGLTHEPAIRLCARLAEITPEGLEHVFLSDSGSVSVEVAIKMCLQYWWSAGRKEKRRLLTWRGGYHGDTLGAMSVCDPEGGMHRMWAGVLAPQVFADVPPAGFRAGVDPAYARHLTDLIAGHAHELAAVIVEPVAQGAGGMRFHDPGYLRVLREATRDNDVLLIFDEIATGFGRTGALFAGADRRLPVAGGHFVHAGGGRGNRARPVPRARARADVHGQPAGQRRGGSLHRVAARGRLEREHQPDRIGVECRSRARLCTAAGS